MPIVGPGQPGHEQLMANRDATRVAQQEHNRRFGLPHYFPWETCPWCEVEMPYGRYLTAPDQPLAVTGETGWPAHPTPDKTTWCPGSLRTRLQWEMNPAAGLVAQLVDQPIELLTARPQYGSVLRNNLPEGCQRWMCLCAMTAQVEGQACTGNRPWPWVARPNYSGRLPSGSAESSTT